MKKVLVIYYSQTGQAFNIANSVLEPFRERKDVQLYFEELKPKKPYPFPWSAMEFFDAMPESVQEVPCELQPFTFNPDEHFDLVILAYQIWYLSPSIPISSFLQSEAGKKVLANKPVITIIGCRNMWVMAQEKVKKRLKDAGVQLAGNIALVDKAANLVSVLTVIGWLIYGQKKGFLKILPESGVSKQDIEGASVFGKIILAALEKNDFFGLQEKLNVKGAVQISTNLLLTEKRGARAFKIWAKFISAKGKAGAPERRGRVKFLLYFLPTLIFLLVPIITVVNLIMWVVLRGRIKREIENYSSVL